MSPKGNQRIVFKSFIQLLKSILLKMASQLHHTYTPCTRMRRKRERERAWGLALQRMPTRSIDSGKKNCGLLPLLHNNKMETKNWDWTKLGANKNVAHHFEFCFHCGALLAHVQETVPAWISTGSAALPSILRRSAVCHRKGQPGRLHLDAQKVWSHCRIQHWWTESHQHQWSGHSSEGRRRS